MAVAAIALLLSACSSSDPASSSTPSSEDAAVFVTRTFDVPDAAHSCLVDAFSQRSEAVTALTSTEELTESEQEALSDVVDACVTPEVFAYSVADGITAAFPPPDPTQTEAQTSCLRDAVLAIDDGQRRVVQAGLLTLEGPIDSELALARGDFINGLNKTCAVSIQP